MARRLAHRLRVTAKLQACAPLHIGGTGDDLEADLPLARNGKNELYVPGTSLAGPLRAWMERHFSPKHEDILNELWGYQEEKSDAGSASHIFVEDATVTLPDGLSEERWDSVGIDRQWGWLLTGSSSTVRYCLKAARLIWRCP